MTSRSTQKSRPDVKENAIMLIVERKKRPGQSKKMLGENNPMFGRTHTLEAREKIRAARLGSKITEEVKQKIKEGTKAAMTLEVRNKMSVSHTGKPSGMSGKKLAGKAKLHMKRIRVGQKPFLGGKHSEETKKEMRLRTLKRIEQNYGVTPQPFYNLDACYYFYLFDSYYNTQGHYAVYGGGEFLIKELGYYPDYINFDLKLIMECDEEKHYDQNGHLKERDVIRQKQIQELYPDFEFRRLKQSIDLKEKQLVH